MRQARSTRLANAPTDRPWSRVRPSSNLVLAGLGLTLATLAGCMQESPPPPPPVRPVLSEVVAPSTETASGFTGTIEPRYSTELGFRVLGRIVVREVDVGDSVKAGQVLASLDPLVLDLSVRGLAADLSKAEGQSVNAAATAERQRALVARRAGTQAELEAAEEARSAAEAAVARARASLAKAREQLSYTRLVSDTDGIVTAVAAEVGQTVPAGQTVVTVARADVREAVVDIPDEIAAGIALGAPFDVTLQIDAATLASGTVREVAPQADAATRSRRVKITLDAPPASFRLGTTVKAAPRATTNTAIDVPRSAILDDGGKPFVWIVDEAARTVSRRPVTVEEASGERLRIASGLETGTRIVTAGVNSLSEGQAVKIEQELVP